MKGKLGPLNLPIMGQFVLSGCNVSFDSLLCISPRLPLFRILCTSPV